MRPCSGHCCRRGGGALRAPTGPWNDNLAKLRHRRYAINSFWRGIRPWWLQIEQDEHGLRQYQIIETAHMKQFTQGEKLLFWGQQC
jgi:hypothetical protein